MDNNTPSRAVRRRQAEATRASVPALYTRPFWLDLGERVLSSAAGGALAVATAAPFALGEVASWQALLAGAGTAALVSLFKGIAASSIGTGSASLAPRV